MVDNDPWKFPRKLKMTCIAGRGVRARRVKRRNDISTLRSSTFYMWAWRDRLSLNLETKTNREAIALRVLLLMIQIDGLHMSDRLISAVNYNHQYMQARREHSVICCCWGGGQSLQKRPRTLVDANSPLWGPFRGPLGAPTRHLSNNPSIRVWGSPIIGSATRGAGLLSHPEPSCQHGNFLGTDDRQAGFLAGPRPPLTTDKTDIILNLICQ